MNNTNIELIKQRDAKLHELKEVNLTLCQCPWWLFKKKLSLIFRMESLYYEIEGLDKTIDYVIVNAAYENQNYNKLHELLKSDFSQFVIKASDRLKPEAKELYILYEMYMNFFLYYNYKFKLELDALIDFVNNFDVKNNGIATEEQVKTYFRI